MLVHIFDILLFLSLLTQSGICFSMKNMVEVEAISVCPNNDKNRYPIRNMNYKRINRTQSVWNFEVNFLDDIGDNIWSNVLLDRWTSGGWVRIPFITKQKNPCTSTQKMFRDIWIEFTKALKLEHPDRCPIPKGNYKVENFIIRMDTIDYPMWNGKLRVTSYWTPTEELKDVYYCFILIVSVKEKV